MFLIPGRRITSYNVCYTKLLRERNDSVFMAVSGGSMGGAAVDYFTNEWLYIGSNNKVTIDVAVKS